MNMSVRELMNILVDLDDNMFMFPEPPKLISRGEVFSHFYKTDIAGLMSHSSIDIGDEDSAMERIKCPIYIKNNKKDIVYNNYLCTCGLLFIFPGEAQLEKHKYLTAYRGMGVCPCSTCIHWHKLMRKCGV